MEREDTDMTPDGLILLVGITGAGKSYFINKLIGKTIVHEGHTIDSETKECNAIVAEVNDETKVAIIDTPGFDDSERSDQEIFQIITTYLATQHMLGLKLYGIIYFHKITGQKLSGSDRFYLDLLRAMCGGTAMRKNVVFATTMWSRLSCPSEGYQTERQLRAHLSAVEQSARFLNFDGSTGMAQYVIMEMIDNDQVVLDIQKEMCDRGLNYDETAAGRLLVPMIERRMLGDSTVVVQLDQDIQRAKLEHNATKVAKLSKEKRERQDKKLASEMQRNKLRRNPKKEAEEKIEEARRQTGKSGKFALSIKDLFPVFAAAMNITVNLLVTFLT